MHFHLPKPLHGWREFAGEVGIIVIGVLIALGAEQLVEDLHWKHQLKEERAALDDEVGANWAAMSARQVIQPCVDRRLDDLALVFARHDKGEPLGLIGQIGRPGVWSGTHSALQMATADGSLAHMSFRDKSAYFGVAGSYDIFATSANEERESWRTLEALDGAADLDSQDWRDLRKAFRDAVDSNRVMKANLVFGKSGEWFNPFRSLPGLKPNRATLNLWMVKALCQPAVKR
ncbi:MAG TPA: hypothetical protein VGU01_08515 [Sphingomicrobium sp.]|nr:hypothetical protein [Sphingomicrobium sp.]